MTDTDGRTTDQSEEKRERKKEKGRNEGRRENQRDDGVSSDRGIEVRVRPSSLVSPLPHMDFHQKRRLVK